MEPNSEMAERLKAFARGDATWAEVEGMTFEEARAIAELGCDLANAGRLDDARLLFEGLVAGNPKDAAAHAALGTVYQKLDRDQDAMVAYDAALNHEPRHPVALANRGELHLRQGNRSGLKDLKLAVESDAEGRTSASRRAKALLQALALVAAERARVAGAIGEEQ